MSIINVSADSEDKDEYKVLLSDTDFPEHTRQTTCPTTRSTTNSKNKRAKNQRNGNNRVVLAFEMVYNIMVLKDFVFIEIYW